MQFTTKIDNNLNIDIKLYNITLDFDTFNHIA